MGKRHFKGGNTAEDKKRRKEAAEKWRSVRGDESNRNPWVLENARLEAFYKAQKFVHGEEDWAAFMKHLQSPLPACFRIWSDYAFADELRNQMLDFAGKTMVLDGVEISAAQQLKWYPGGYGYKLGTDRRSIRKLDGLNDLHKWMMQHTDNGNITRQEAVSMVPPLALNVSPHHRCLDMCAAPGSKTSQLLEVVNRSLVDSEDKQGLVVANDADTDRAYMLVHQCKRINSPLLVVSTHKGQSFPTITTTKDTDGVTRAQPFFDRVLCDVPCSGDGTLRKNPAIWAKWSTSGGMTLHPLQLMIAQRGLQLLQEGGLMVYSTCSMSPYEDEAVVAELLRAANGGLELVDAREFLPLFKCRPGLTTWHVLDDFYAVKSENREKRQRAREQQQATEGSTGDAEGDADAAEGIDTAAEVDDGNIMDVSTTDPVVDGTTESNSKPAKKEDFSHVEDADLRRCLEMGMHLYPDFSAVPEHMNRKIRKSFFPPSAEEKEWMHLERCLRCVPQDEDTGGFFVATLRKIAKPTAPKASSSCAPTTEPVVVPSTDVEVTPVDNDCDEAACAAAATEEGDNNKQSHASKINRNAVDFRQWDEDTFQRIKLFYGFDDALTRECFFIREDFSLSGNPGSAGNVAAKSIYLIPSSVRSLMEGDRDGRLKVVCAGVKVFEKKVLRSGDIDYRLLQDGIGYLEPFISKRKVSVKIQDFCNMLGGGLVSYSTLTAEALASLNAIPSGVVIATYEYRPEDVLPAEVADEGAPVRERPAVTGVHKFHAICWKGNSRAINVMCGRVEIESIKHQLTALGVLRPKIGAVRLDAAGAAPVTTALSEPVNDEAVLAADTVNDEAC